MLRRILILILLPMSGPLPCPAEESPVFNNPFNWEHPEQVVVPPEELVFGRKYSRYFKSDAIHFIGRSYDGWVVTLGFSGWDLGIASGWVVHVAVAEPDGTGHWFRQEVKQEELFIARDRLQIRFGDSTIEGRGRKYRLRLTVEDFSCDLALHSFLPPWKPGDGTAFLSSRRDVYFHMVVPSPWALMRGKIRLKEKSVSLKGECYGDLSSIVQPLNKFNSPGYSFRGFSPRTDPAEEGWFMSLLEYVSHEEYGRLRQPMLLLANQDGWVLTSKNFSLLPLEFQVNKQTAYKFLTRFKIELVDRGYRLLGEYRSHGLYSLTDIFEELHPSARSLAGMFVKRPVIFRTLGSFRGILRRPDGRVERLHLAGPAEYMIIR